MFRKLKETTRKAWSIRSLRWLELLPDCLRMKDISIKSIQTELKACVKHNIPVRGDRILRGKPLPGDKMEKEIKMRSEGGEDPEGTAERK